MPELLELLSTRGANFALTGLERLSELYYQQATDAVTLVLGLPAEVARNWREVCQAVVAGHTQTMQSQRESFQESVCFSLTLLRRAHQFASNAAVLAGQEVPHAGDLTQGIAELQRMKERVCARWQTAEDLEDLVAEATALSAEVLDAVAAKYGFPQKWFDEDSNPF
jgi:hypothetical protein